MLSPGLAQSNDRGMNANPPPAAQSTPSTATPALDFLRQQEPNEWLSSDLVETVVTGAGNQSIGVIEDLVIDSGRMVKAVVIGVGGFLGIGEKSVAVPMTALKIARDADGDDIGKIVVNYSKEQLERAPALEELADVDDNETTGSGNR